LNILSLLKKYNIHPKKSLGQNFLTAVPTIEKIVSTLMPTKDDKILEIGPGPGVMTKMFTEYAKFVAAIEADKQMVHLLENEWGMIPNLHIISGDILDTNLDKLLGGEGKWLFVGNIPYNISSPLLFHLRKFREHFKYGLLMLQKEVAVRLTASPGSKDYGILSIAMQAVAKVKHCFNVSSTSFYPEPKVDSAIVKISFEDGTPYDIDDLNFFTVVVRAAFSTRRKKLKNALIQSNLIDIPAEKIASAIKEAGISDNRRAEELDIPTFIKLTNLLS
jgi:16S rRNA (adenine1518-N6/adenine1519-N6)-dimethyltransferase